jgi:uncharacterized protein YndB with AHSA1/START domain
MSKAQSRFVYVSYIRATPEKVWAALTQPEFTKQYWFGASPISTWKAGANWKLVLDSGRVADTGAILEADPPRRLVIKWLCHMREDFTAEGYSRCAIELEPVGDGVKLTIVHENDRPNSPFINEGIADGWPKIISSLKSLMETGEVLEMQQ